MDHETLNRESTDAPIDSVPSAETAPVRKRPRVDPADIRASHSDPLSSAERAARYRASQLQGPIRATLDRTLVRDEPVPVPQVVQPRIDYRTD